MRTTYRAMKRFVVRLSDEEAAAVERVRERLARENHGLEPTSWGAALRWCIQRATDQDGAAPAPDGDPDNGVGG